MRQLSAHDALFLYADTPHANANVTLVHIYDPSTAPGGRVRFKSILAHIAARLDRLPVLRQRLAPVPLNLDFPYWVDDEHFDLEYHVRHIALPRPGDWRQFCIQASRIHARALDLNRPLWEIYVIEGLDGLQGLPRGSFALLTKMHHAAIDVEHGSEITTLLHDTEPSPPAGAPPAPWLPQPAPGTLPMVVRGVAGTVASSVRLAGPLGRAVRRGLPSALGLLRDVLRRTPNQPVTRFNAAVSPHRVFETRRFALDEFRAIRRLVAGASVDDAVLAVCGGALRRYLQQHGELPAASLSALAPYATRRSNAQTAAELAWARVPLGTHLADPVQRLAFVHESAAATQVRPKALRVRELTEAGSHAPAATLALAAKWLSRATAGIGRRAPLAHCAVTHVPGPSVPLFLCGARMTYFSALMPIADGLGLVLAVTSYDARLIVSPTSCRELMPDPQAFAQALRDSFQEYLALARKPRPAPAAPAPTKAARAAKAKGAAARAPKPRKARAALAPGPRAATSRAARAGAPTPARRRASSSARRRPTNPAG
jgi:WS/DGAT/MGAT family acyltransferase